jgi:uncharacterized protein (DUF1697 family)
MKDLITLYKSLTFNKVKTYVQSGNVIFDSSVADPEKLSELIEAKIKQIFSFSVNVIIRTANELQQIIINNPFLKKEGIDIGRLHVTFLSDIPSEIALNEVSKIKDETDDFVILGKEVYLFCPNGYGRTNLSNNFFEKKLGIITTTRNWNTVNKLMEIAKE